MLDINLFRADKGGDPDRVRDSQRWRFADVSLVDEVIRLDEKWRQLLYDSEQLNKQLNLISKQISDLRKKERQRPGDAAAGGGQPVTPSPVATGITSHSGRESPAAADSVDDLVSKSKGIKTLIAEARASEAEVLAKRDETLAKIGNLVHEEVPKDKDEANNRVLRQSGLSPSGSCPPSKAPWMLGHPDLLTKLGMVNLEAGQAVAGGRGYFLTGYGVLLNQALINYGLQFLISRGFEPVTPPYFMKQEIMSEVAQLTDFDEELYRITSSSDKQSEEATARCPEATGSGTDSSGNSIASGSSSSSSNDKYLIATSEQPLCALHRRSWFEAAELPLRYAGLSTCFRREVGSHGKDTLGIFRVHQFDKVEMFCLASPEGGQSWEAMEGMMGHAEDFYKSLAIPYRVVSIVSGALNQAAAMKHDLEAWFPASGTYRELVSCSNCTDYQSRALDIRMRSHQGTAASSAPSSSFSPGSQGGAARQGSSAGGTGRGGGGGGRGGGGGSHVHMLNSTLTATQRTLSCLVENHQTPEGIKIPEPLRPYMMGIDFIPFIGGAAMAGAAGGQLRRNRVGQVLFTQALRHLKG